MASLWALFLDHHTLLFSPLMTISTVSYGSETKKATLSLILFCQAPSRVECLSVRGDLLLVTNDWNECHLCLLVGIILDWSHRFCFLVVIDSTDVL